MKLPRTPHDLVDTFDMLVPEAPDITSRRMFGYPSRFMNGNLFTGLHGDYMILRLSENDRAEFLKETGSHLFEPMPGRAMKEYVVVPNHLINDGLLPWLEKSMAYARSLPPKQPKTKP